MVHGGAVSPARRGAAFPGRAREAMIRIISLPACHKHCTHQGGGRSGGWDFSPTGLRLLLLFGLLFLTVQSLLL